MIKECDTKEMETLVKQGAMLIDVREMDELTGGTIPGHVHMPLSCFDDFKDQLPKDKVIVFYCRSGRRSLKSAELAKAWGCNKDLYSLRGGFLAYSGEI